MEAHKHRQQGISHSKNSMKAILTKLLAVQKAIKPIVKDEVNPHFKNRYFDINSLLAEAKPILNENGLVLTQPLNGDSLTTIIYEVESGETIMSTVTLPQVTDPQKMGSAISYFRRYSLVSLLGLEGEDDDAELASKTPQITSQAPKVQQATQNAAQTTTEAVHATCEECGGPKREDKYRKCYNCNNKKASVPVIEVP